MSLAAQIAADVDAVFLNTSDFATTASVLRGASSIPSINVLIASTKFQVSTEFGFTEYESRDFIFDPNKFNFGAGVVLPQRGDKFTEGGFNYVVTTPQGVDFYSLDENRVLMTVHTTKTN